MFYVFDGMFDGLLIISNTTKHDQTRTYLMLNFVSSFIRQPHQSPRVFDDYFTIPSDLVFLLLYSSVVITYDWQEKTISYLTLAQLQLQKKSRLRKKNTS